MTINPLPPATHTFLPPDGVDHLAAARPLAVQLIREHAARSKRSDTELMRMALGNAPTPEAGHAAFAMFKARTGELDTLTDAEIEKAAATLKEYEPAAVPA